jgi:hypothetical protein
MGSKQIVKRAEQNGRETGSETKRKSTISNASQLSTNSPDEATAEA